MRHHVRVVDPATPRPRERWLRVVRDDEVPAGDPDAPPARPAPAASAAPVAPAPAAPAPPTPGAARPGRQARSAPAAVAPAGGVAGVGGRPAAVDARRGWVGRLGWTLGASGLGTGAALGADRLVGGLDGRPALHLLVLLALPFWDGLPARPGPRLLVLAVVVAAVAATWLALAGLRPEAWWGAEISFGLACALVGATEVALSARHRPGRTVEG